MPETGLKQATADELTAEYWASLGASDRGMQGFLAKLVVASRMPPTSDAYYSALCVLLANGDVETAKRAIEKALLSDFETCKGLLPLLGHAHQLSMDSESAHLVFETCARLGLFEGRNGWAAEAANEVTYALAEHLLHKAIINHTKEKGSRGLDALRVLARTLYEGHFAGARALAGGAASDHIQELRFPDFIIAGSAKCGTTYLYDLICGSPSVWDRKPKEIHYFSAMHRFGSPFYSKFFELCPVGLRCGEASPDYLDTCNSEHPTGRLDTARRIHEACPSTKVIVVLRDPALRAVSFYNQMRSNDASRGPRPGHNRQDDLTISDLETYWQGRILTSGKFINPLKHYVDVMGRENLLVLSFSELMHLDSVSARVCGFLDIEPPAPEQLASLRKNAGGHERPSDGLYSSLRDYYSDSLVELEREFGIRL